MMAIESASEAKLRRLKQDRERTRRHLDHAYQTTPDPYCYRVLTDRLVAIDYNIARILAYLRRVTPSQLEA